MELVVPYFFAWLFGVPMLILGMMLVMDSIHEHHKTIHRQHRIA